MNMVNLRIRTIMAIGVAAILSVAIVLITVVVSGGHVVTRASVKDEDVCAFKRDKVMETLKAICYLKFNMGVKYATTDVECGDKMTMQSTETSPEVSFPDAVEGRSYTLLMLDPDAPGSSVANLTFFLHWAVTDLNVNDLKTGGIVGKEIMKYTRPNPPLDDGYHRYQLVLFMTATSGEVTLSGDGRGGFSLEDFANNNGVCSLVSAFEFKTKKDSVNK